MKKHLLGCMVAIFAFLYTNISAQSNFPHGFKYQGALRDESGLVMPNRKVDFKIAIIGQDSTKGPLFSELHQVETDQNGMFELVIGAGAQGQGDITDLPWGTEALSLSIGMAENGTTNFSPLGIAPIMVVPYALHAKISSEIIEPTNSEGVPQEKNGTQSIFWTTSGNAKTDPRIHFIGTKDNNNLVFKINGKAFLTLTPLGKLLQNSDVPAGPDTDKNSYQMIVEGTKNTQGVWIEIKGSRSKANNFVTFVDDDGIQGRIQGQTLTELEQSDPYIIQSTVTALNTLALTSKIVEITVKGVAEAISALAAAITCIISLGTLACTDIDAHVAGATACAVKAGGWIVELAAFVTATTKSFERIRNAVGVSYASSNKDYAEWLLRNTGEKDMVFGEIVGVSGGIVSRNTSFSMRNLVVSQYPTVLGNMPATGTEANYEKIAFMGQVLVRVIGKVKSGDYILPSGNNDGLGIAVHPQDLAIADFPKIVGTAWGNVDNQAPFNLVNVAVGLKSNQIASKVDMLEQKVDRIVGFLEGKSTLHAEPNAIAYKSAGPNLTGALFSPSLADQDAIQAQNRAELNKLLTDHPDEVRKMYKEVESILRAQGQDLSHPVIARFIKDPVNTLKQINNKPEEFAAWAAMAVR